MATAYINLSIFTTEIKKKNGEILRVKPNKSAETTKENPFVKIRFSGLEQHFKNL